MKYCYISEENFKYFKPLLQEDQQIRMMNDPSVLGMGCYDVDTACGIVLYTVNEENMTVRILYVAVSMSYQRKGVATGMLKALGQSAYEDGFITLSNFYARDKEDPRYAMFDNTDEFTMEKVPGGVYIIDYEKLRNAVYSIPQNEYNKSTSGTSITLKDCPVQARKSIESLLYSAGVDVAQMKTHIDENLSYAVLGKDGAPTAFAIISHFEEHHLYEISYIMGVHPEQISDLVTILTHGVTETFEQMQPEDVLRFSTAVASVDRLAEKFFSKDCKAENFYLAGYNGDSVG